MRVLFAVSNEEISEAIVKRYQRDFKEIISYKNVYYFNAIIKELQKDKNYDRIVISEELEAFTNTQYSQIDKFIFDKLDSISDEAANTEGDDIPIILICSDRREKGEDMLVKLFGIGIYNALIGNDRSVSQVCQLLNRPRLKKDAKTYYEIDTDDVSYQAENENDVSEVEIQNILAHYRRLGKDEKKYVESFDNIASQYNDTQLKIIAKFLPLNVRAVLEEKSPKYQELISYNNRVSDNLRLQEAKKKANNAPSEKLLKTKDKILSKPVVIPSSVNMSGTKKLARKLTPHVGQVEQQEPVQPQYNSVSTTQQTKQQYDQGQNNLQRKTLSQLFDDDTDEEENNNSLSEIDKLIKEQEEQSGTNNNTAIEPLNEMQEEETKNGQDESLEETLDEQPKKRGRGRPRKTPLPDPNAPAKPKRGRGRPRKNPLPEDEEEVKNDLSEDIKATNESTIPENQDDAEDIAISNIGEAKPNIQSNDQSTESSSILPGLEDEEEEEDDILPGLTSSTTNSISNSNAQNSNNQSLNSNSIADNAYKPESTYGGYNNNYNHNYFMTSQNTNMNKNISGMGTSENINNINADINKNIDGLDTNENTNTGKDIENIYTNRDINTNRSLSKEINYEDIDISGLLTSNKKVACFVGTSKNGTSFMVNNIADITSKMGINTAILDTTKNRNSYYIYTQNEESLRKTAMTCIHNLLDGNANGIQVNKNLTVYTSLPEETEGIGNAGKILQTLLQKHSLILIDCDFKTPMQYFKKTQEIYLVQSFDILTIQPLTAFLRELKSKDILEQNKLRVVLNKALKLRGVNDKTIIGGMAFYNDPAMSFMTELFDKDTIRYITVPFDEETYTYYLENIINCEVSTKRYPKHIMQILNDLANMVYPLVSGRSTYTPPTVQRNANSNNIFSASMNSTLDQMKRNF